MKKIVINDAQCLVKYNIKNIFNKKIKDRRLLTKEEFNKRKWGRFYKVNNDYYFKLPLTSIKTKKIIAASLAGLLVAGSAATVTVFYIPHGVSLKSNELVLTNAGSCRLANDYKCTFKIKDELLENNYMKLININSVKVNGKEIPADGYSFIYQTNKKNELTINKKYCGGNIEIDASLVENKQNDNCFFFEFDLDDYVTFEAEMFTYPKQDKIGWIEAIDVEKTKTVDDIYLNKGYDMAVIGKDDLEVIGVTFEHNIFVVREDNRFSLTLKSKNDNALPDDIWFRSNARFTKIDEDFTLTYSSDKKSATLEVPYFFVRDNGSIRRKPAEAK